MLTVFNDNEAKKVVYLTFSRVSGEPGLELSSNSLPCCSTILRHSPCYLGFEHVLVLFFYPGLVG